MKAFVALSFAAAGVVAGGCAARPEPPSAPEITAEEILRLSRAGVPAGVIVARIEMSRFPRRLTVEEIISLKAEGVSEEVLEALIRAEDRPELREPRRVVVHRYSPWWPWYHEWHWHRWGP